MRQKTQSALMIPPRLVYTHGSRRLAPRRYETKEILMGTCPKCKLRLRKNGNHVKLGSVWMHKTCPAKPARAAKRG
jgi:hypothetical protein